MTEKRQAGKPSEEEEEVPAFFKKLGSGSPKPRQKFCGMFCPVEGSLENKTIDFDSLSVGRGSSKIVAQQKDVAHLGSEAQSFYSWHSRKGGEPSVDSGRKVEIRRATGKEALQNLNDKLPFVNTKPSCNLSLNAPGFHISYEIHKLP
uniref:Uncharacterized protein n=1 Tax=Sphaerodactylus townsendi TaxID=933632 RepID=A0ACB8EXP7_9SAUR